MPSQAVTAALKPGQKVPLRVLASQTASSGSYTLSVDPARLGPAIGTVANMEVVASANGGMDAYSFPRDLVASPAGRPVLAAPFTTQQMAPQTANLRLTRTKNKGCGTGYAFELVFKKNLGSKAVIVGALYSRVKDITAIFKFKKGQSSSLGVGLSASTAYANFSVSGTHSVSADSGAAFNTFHGHTAHLYKTGFKYGNYRWKCYDSSGNSYWGAWQVQSTDYYGGAATSKLYKSPDATHCAWYQAGSKFFRDSSSAWEFKAGVNISKVIGIDLSAHTGYDQETTIAYKVGSQGRKICGLDGGPGETKPAPRLVVAGAP